MGISPNLAHGRLRHKLHLLRFRESLGAVFVGAGVGAVAGFGGDAAGRGIRPNRNSGDGAVAGTGAPADFAGAGPGAAVAAAVVAVPTIGADGGAVSTDNMLPAPLLKLSAATKGKRTQKRATRGESHT